MKAFNGKTVRAILAAVGLLAGAGAAQAFDSETGLVKLAITGSGLYDNDVLSVEMASPNPTGTGRCSGMYMVIAGEGNKAVLQALIAANVAGKSVTIDYMLNEDDSCTLVWAHL